MMQARSARVPTVPAVESIILVGHRQHRLLLTAARELGSGHR